MPRINTFVPSKVVYLREGTFDNFLFKFVWAFSNDGASVQISQVLFVTLTKVRR